MGKVTSFEGIDIVVRTRDEHCEPHVHAFHSGKAWELRVFFSYVSDRVTDIEPLHGKLPKRSTVQTVMNKLIDYLDEARTLYWHAVNDVCLDNKHIVLVGDLAYAARPNDPGALLITTARYLPAQRSIEYLVSGLAPQIARCP